MSVSETGINVIDDESVDVRTLGGNLRKRWDTLVGDHAGRPVHRSFRLNLVAVCAREELGELRPIVEKFASRHSCRAFVVALAPGLAMSARHGATVYRTPSGSGRVVCERFIFEADASESARLTSLIRPRLLGDLQTVFYAHGPIPGDAWDAIRMLSATSGLFVFDSSTLAQPVEDRQRIKAIASEWRDLGWLRLCPWRRALAQSFEQFEWHAEEPTTVLIEHDDTHGSHTAATQLGGWLEERLGADTKLAVSTPTGTALDTQPHRVVLTHRDVELEVGHCGARPRLHSKIQFADRCLIPFEIPASSSPRGVLLAAAADGA